MDRKSGLLLPVFSLPSRYGTGTFGQAAYDFVDFAAAAGQSYWQMLPLNPALIAESPYQALSAFAINPYFIDLDELVADNLLQKTDLADLDVPNAEYADNGIVFVKRREVLKRAFQRFQDQKRQTGADYAAFMQKQAYWLDGYAEFMAIKQQTNNAGLQTWPRNIRDRQAFLASGNQEALSEAADYYRFLQFIAFKQYAKLRAYATSKGIGIIGDVPIYVSMDSADVWEHPELFQLDLERRPVKVAGVPPDYFSLDGQLWGNPLYDYEAMAKDGFAWWQQRVETASLLFDVLRIDHFRGFADYWSIPAEAKTAKEGQWIMGPGAPLIDAIAKAAGPMRIIAEDLGSPDKVTKDLKEYSGWPGMHIFQFGLESMDLASLDLPDNFRTNSVAYIGTHDNQTLEGFLSTHGNKKQQAFIAKALKTVDPKGFVSSIFWQLAESCADTVIFSMTDVLDMDDSYRINIPSTVNNTNWRLKLPKDYATKEKADWLKRIVTATKRR